MSKAVHVYCVPIFLALFFVFPFATCNPDVTPAGTNEQGITEDAGSTVLFPINVTVPGSLLNLVNDILVELEDLSLVTVAINKLDKGNGDNNDVFFPDGILASRDAVGRVANLRDYIIELSTSQPLIPGLNRRPPNDPPTTERPVDVDSFTTPPAATPTPDLTGPGPTTSTVAMAGDNTDTTVGKVGTTDAVPEATAHHGSADAATEAPGATGAFDDATDVADAVTEIADTTGFVASETTNATNEAEAAVPTDAAAGATATTGPAPADITLAAPSDMSPTETEVPNSVKTARRRKLDEASRPLRKRSRRTLSEAPTGWPTSMGASVLATDVITQSTDPPTYATDSAPDRFSNLEAKLGELLGGRRPLGGRRADEGSGQTLFDHLMRKRSSAGSTEPPAVTATETVGHTTEPAVSLTAP